MSVDHIIRDMYFSKVNIKFFSNLLKIAKLLGMHQFMSLAQSKLLD